MHPAFSVIFPGPRWIGAAQGMLMWPRDRSGVPMANRIWCHQDSRTFYAMGSLVALILLGGGLLAGVSPGKPSYF